MGFAAIIIIKTAAKEHHQPNKNRQLNVGGFWLILKEDDTQC
jgi:hypothetical protein